MSDILTYALIAGGSYISSRNPVNQFPIPKEDLDWRAVRHESLPSGFETITYFNGKDIRTSNDIVISYAGTDPKDLFGDIILADGALGTGSTARQLVQAAEYYIRIKIENPGSNITLTGHSLGGGLASLIAVFFNEKAVTFDQAPFRLSARPLVAEYLKSQLESKYSAVEYPNIGLILSPLDGFAKAIGSSTNLPNGLAEKAGGQVLHSSIIPMI